MARIDPTKKAKKWASRVSGAVDDFKDGVNAVTVSPAQQAIAKKETLLRRFQDAVNRGDWEAALNAVGLQDWKTATVQGANRLVDGAQKGQPKMQKYLTAAAPRYEAIRQEIASMPNGTDAERKARMDRNLELMKAMKGVGK